MQRNYLIHLLKNRGIVNADNTLNIKFNNRLLLNPELMQLVIDGTLFLRYSANAKTRLHVLLKHVTEQPVCKTCGKIVTMRLDGVYRYTFPTYCSSACFSSEDEVKTKRNTTNLERYGAISYTATTEGKQKILNTKCQLTS